MVERRGEVFIFLFGDWVRLMVVVRNLSWVSEYRFLLVPF